MELYSGPKSCAMCQYLSDNTDALINLKSVCPSYINILLSRATFNTFVVSLLQCNIVEKFVAKAVLSFAMCFLLHLYQHFDL